MKLNSCMAPTFCWAVLSITTDSKGITELNFALDLLSAPRAAPAKTLLLPASSRVTSWTRRNDGSPLSAHPSEGEEASGRTCHQYRPRTKRAIDTGQLSGPNGGE